MRRWLAVLAFCVVAALLLGAAKDRDPWVAPGPDGKLVYRTTPRGDRIADFSYAGYMGGGVPLPHVPIRRILSPTGGDDTALIQQAIDQVSAMPPAGGFRGTVMLQPGVFHCSATLHIRASGVVLAGRGAQAGGTALQMTGQPHVAIAIEGSQTVQPAGALLHIVEAYVPSGAQAFTLDDASSLAIGDTIRITRYTTPEWLHFMGMDRMTRDGKEEHWVGGKIATLRRVASKNGNRVRLDVPLTDSYDRRYLRPEGAEVQKASLDGGIEQVGVEAMRIEAPPRQVAFDQPLFQAMTVSGLRDGWVRGLRVKDTTEGIDLTADTARITVEDVYFYHAVQITSPAKPADFALRGAQALLLRCGGDGMDQFYVITGARNQGPNVVLESKFTGDGHVQPHQRWATGLLVDNVEVPYGGIDLMNRGEMGSGHGWTMGWGVVWNSRAANLVIQNPPGALNWSIGTSGEELRAPMKIMGVKKRDLGPDLPQGVIESPDHPVQPQSLYRAQLRERLGAEALKALEP